MYVSPNFPSKAALKRAIAEGQEVVCFQPGLGDPAPETGTAHVEGPHYPKPHMWGATVAITNGFITKVIA